MKIVGKTLALSSIFLLSLASTLAWGGNSGGGGDNYRVDHGAAWFLGKANTIKYCIEVSNQFGVPTPTLQTEVSAVFAQWDAYIKKYVYTFPLATKAIYIGDCKDTKGSEDLSFYFGINNQLVQKAKKLYDDPIAMAQKTKYDISKGWGKGFVWLINSQTSVPKEKFPDWSKSDKLYGALLHEVGHVLGNGHAQGTIMGKDIAADIRNSYFTQSNFRNIDWEISLSGQLDRTYKGEAYSWATGYRRPDQKLAQKVFTYLVGKNPVGNVSATFKPYYASSTDERNEYVISDQNGNHTFELARDNMDWSNDEAYEFTYVETNYNQSSLQGGVRHTEVDNCSFETNQGQKVAAVIRYNMAGFAVIIDAAIDGKMVNIFMSDRLDGTPRF